MFRLELQRHVKTVVIESGSEMVQRVNPNESRAKSYGLPKAVILTDHEDMRQSMPSALVEYVTQGGLLLVTALFGPYTRPAHPGARNSIFDDFVPYTSACKLLQHPMNVNTALSHLAVSLNVDTCPIAVQAILRPNDTAVYLDGVDVPKDVSDSRVTPVSLQQRGKGQVGYIGYIGYTGSTRPGHIGYTQPTATTSQDTMKAIKLTVGTILAMCGLEPTSEQSAFHQSPLEFVAPWKEQVSTI